MAEKKLEVKDLKDSFHGVSIHETRDAAQQPFWPARPVAAESSESLRALACGAHICYNTPR